MVCQPEGKHPTKYEAFTVVVANGVLVVVIATVVTVFVVVPTEVVVEPLVVRTCVLGDQAYNEVTK